MKVGGVRVKDVRFADDQAMISSSEQGLQRVMDGLNVAAKRYNMKINVKKMQVMKISRSGGEVINCD